MFQLTAEEAANLRCQIDTSSSGYGGRRYRPYAFTEQGVAMLSSVLRSERAVQVNLAIMRVFVRLRETLALHKELVGCRDERRAVVFWSGFRSQPRVEHRAAKQGGKINRRSKPINGCSRWSPSHLVLQCVAR